LLPSIDFTSKELNQSSQLFLFTLVFISWSILSFIMEDPQTRSDWINYPTDTLKKSTEKKKQI